MKQNGFTLVELLVSLIIFSIGLLGVLRMGLFATHYNQQALWQSIAVTRGAQMLDYLLVADNAFVKTKLVDWQQHNNRLLPQAVGQVFNDHNKQQIQLRWRVKHSELASSCGVGWQCMHIALQR